MIISINNTIQATQIFLVLFVLGLALTLRKKTAAGIFSVALTQELKGFAILAVVFSHIGYYLASDHRFLFPLSVAAGVGVNLFLFLSGYGLVASALSKPLSVMQFYQRRLLKLYGPLWLTVLLFLGLDFLVIGKTYDLGYISQALLGFFPRADVSLDLNSPLWYITLIIFYYLLFPWVFSRKYPWLSAIVLYLAGYFLVRWNPALLGQVMRLYRVHILAFPLGVFIGSVAFKYKGSLLEARVKQIWQKGEQLKFLKQAGYWLLTVFLLWLFGYTAYYSHVGDVRWLEEATSLLTGGAIVVLFMIKKFESRLLYWFGLYAYEIYLLHWPIMSRFDLFYRFTPSWLATIFYLAFFLGIGWITQWLADRISAMIFRSSSVA